MANYDLAEELSEVARELEGLSRRLMSQAERLAPPKNGGKEQEDDRGATD